MNRKFHYIASLIFQLLVFFSCATDDLKTNNEVPEGMKAIQLNLKILNQQQGNVFRSAENGKTLKALATEPGNKYNNDLNENKIDNIELFLFNPDGSLKRRASNTSGLQKTGDDTQAVLRVLIPYAEVSQYENKSFKIVVVANATVAIPPSVNSLSTLQEVIQHTADINKEDQPQAKFLMDGEINSQPITWGGNVTYTVPGELSLRRAAAKIRLRIREVNVNEKANGQIVHYEMVGTPQVRVVHYTEKTSLLQNAPYAVQASDWKSADYRVMTLHTFPDKTNDSDPGAVTHDFFSAATPFYAYENDWENEGANETYLTLKIDFKAKDPVSGNYGDARPYYYRIPVNYRMPLPDMTDEEKTGIRKLQRNYLYDIVSSIGILGSEDEGEPMDVAPYIAVQPWNVQDPIDGAIRNAHYLMVKEPKPLMANIGYREVEYLSDLPVRIDIDKTEYEYYDQYARHIRVEEKKYDANYNLVTVYIDGEVGQQYYTGDSQFPTKFDGTTVTSNESQLNRKMLEISHRIPVNYVPFHIYFTVTHINPPGDTNVPLFQKVHVIQYPPKYVTGSKSPGFSGGNALGADFRFHDPLGAMAYYPGSNIREAQGNDVFYKITTIVNVAGEKIGDPTDSNGRTKTDAVSNRLISPEFIIASQHGMSQPIPQYAGGSEGWVNTQYGAGYGALSSRFPDRNPYYDPDESYYDTDDRRQPNYKSYKNAGDRCAGYFEGEYGMDGTYTEYYKDSNNQNRSRQVSKTFTYKGRWRMPTKAELEYIDAIQDNSNSVVKSLLWGQYYWSAETNKAYRFSDNSWTTPSNAYVRCVFDTYKVQ